MEREKGEEIMRESRSREERWALKSLHKEGSRRKIGHASGCLFSPCRRCSCYQKQFLDKLLPMLPLVCRINFYSLLNV